MNHVLADSEKSSEAVRVKVLPLDEILKGQSPSVLKIDVEGFETPVLAGARTTLSNPSLHSVIMELNGSGSRYGYNENEILDTMHHYGFSAYRYAPFSRELKTLDWKNSLSGNTLFLRNVEMLGEKLRRSPKILVNDVFL